METWRARGASAGAGDPMAAPEIEAAAPDRDEGGAAAARGSGPRQH